MTLTGEQLAILRSILDAPSDDFAELVRLARLRPETDFRHTNLRRVDFGRANLAGYDFTGADLRDADLRKAWVKDALFDAADIRGAHLPKGRREGEKIRSPWLRIIKGAACPDIGLDRVQWLS